MRKYIVCLMGLVMVLGIAGLSSAAIVTDPAGDKFGTGPTDILAAQAEQLAPATGLDVLKISYTATPNLGGIVIFEADVDDSTGTGGSLSMTGIPVTPCACKTTAGIDVAIISVNRDQAGQSNSGVCQEQANARSRKFGEWYSVTMAIGQDKVGALRGFSDPTPTFANTKTSRTFPWATILVYANYEASFSPGDHFSYADAIDPATTKWQLSVWTDPAYSGTNRDDFGDGLTYFNISDVVPNGDGNLVNGVDAGTALTFCEGNFDFDLDVDGADASKFKTDFGRSPLKNPCPEANYFY